MVVGPSGDAIPWSKTQRVNPRWSPWIAILLAKNLQKTMANGTIVTVDWLLKTNIPDLGGLPCINSGHPPVTKRANGQPMTHDCSR
jgi:hypothetical protein